MAKTKGYTCAPDDPAKDFDRSKPSRILFAMNGTRGLALWWVGADAWQEAEEFGHSDMEDLGFNSEGKPGLEVWEGYYNVYGCGDGDYDSEPVGQFRSLTAQELMAVKKGVCPWDPTEWHIVKAEIDGGGNADR